MKWPKDLTNKMRSKGPGLKTSQDRHFCHHNVHQKNIKYSWIKKLKKSWSKEAETIIKSPNTKVRWFRFLFSAIKKAQKWPKMKHWQEDIFPQCLFYEDKHCKHLTFKNSIFFILRPPSSMTFITMIWNHNITSALFSLHEYLLKQNILWLSKC